MMNNNMNGVQQFSYFLPVNGQPVVYSGPWQEDAPVWQDDTYAQGPQDVWAGQLVDSYSDAPMMAYGPAYPEMDYGSNLSYPDLYEADFGPEPYAQYGGYAPAYGQESAFKASMLDAGSYNNLSRMNIFLNLPFKSPASKTVTTDHVHTAGCTTCQQSKTTKTRKSSTTKKASTTSKKKSTTVKKSTVKASTKPKKPVKANSEDNKPEPKGEAIQGRFYNKFNFGIPFEYDMRRRK